MPKTPRYPLRPQRALYLFLACGVFALLWPTPAVCAAQAQAPAWVERVGGTLFCCALPVSAVAAVTLLKVILAWLGISPWSTMWQPKDSGAAPVKSMDEPRVGPRCPTCGMELPRDLPQGLCPRCLLQVAIAPEQCEGASPPTAAYNASAPVAGPHELAAHFPQLEILELLGKGGMGAVYKARQPHLDRLVALKVLTPEAKRDPAFAERFAREARALARLNHPHIVGVHDFGQNDGLYWLLMEYVDGVNLRQAMRAGQLTPEEALRIVPQLCEALQFAHDEGVVHRDIKPENILLDKRGRVKVADFGLAKLLGQSAADTGLTGTQQVMGTLHYMAPEQLARAKAVDHRADIYSLGVTFYEMLTGELPLGRFPPPSQTAGVDVRLDAVVLRTLEREPAERFQQVSEVGTAIGVIAATPTPAAFESPARMVNGDQTPTLAGAPDKVRDELQRAGNWIFLAAYLVLSLWIPVNGLLVFIASKIQRGNDPNRDVLFAGWITAFVVHNSWTLIACPLLTIGGLAMRSARGRRRALLGSIVALLPPSPIIILGLPLGIWCLSLLRRREVRDAFEQAASLVKERALRSTPPQSPGAR